MHNNNDLNQTIKPMTAEWVRLRGAILQLIGLCMILTIAYIYEKYNAALKKQAENNSDICMDPEHDNSDAADLSGYVKFLFASLGGSFFMGNLTSPAFGNFYKALIPFLPDTINNDHDLRTFIKYRDLINKMRPTLSETNEKRLDRIANALRIAINAKNADMSDEALYVKSCSAALEFMTTVLNVDDFPGLPMETIAQRNAMFIKIDNMLKHHPHATAAALKEKLLLPFFARAMHNMKNLSTSPLLLVGPHGVGKTWTVDQIAKILGDIPVIRGFNSVDHGQTYDEWYREFNMKLVSCHAYGKYMAARRRGKYFIVFLDEFDKILKQYCSLARLDSNTALDKIYSLLNVGCTEEFVDPYSALELDLSNMLLVLACNKLPSEVDELYKPIDDRCIILKCAPLTQENKKGIILEQAVEKYAKAGINFTKRARKEIEEKVAADKEPGVRQLLLWLNTSIANKKASELLLRGTIWDPELNQTKLQNTGRRALT